MTTQKKRDRVRFDRQEIGEQPDDAPTLTTAEWEVTLDGRKVGVLRRLGHRTAQRDDDGGLTGWKRDRTEYAFFGERGKKADLPEQRRKLDAISVVRELVLKDAPAEPAET